MVERYSSPTELTEAWGCSVIKKIAAVLALVLTAFVLAPALVAPAQAADDYTAGMRTSCHLSMPAVVGIGHAPRIRVHVRPNGPAPAAGLLSLIHI